MKSTPAARRVKRKAPALSMIGTQEFIAALMPEDAISITEPELGQPCVIVSTPWTPPGAEYPVWPPKAYVANARHNDELYVNWATYRAVPHTPEHGRRAGIAGIEPRANNDAFHEQHFLMLDDIGTAEKSVLAVDDPRVQAATYLMETSKGNFQAGYKLAAPIGAEDNARLRMALVAAGLGDEGALKTPQRWCRVPGSVNKKPGKDGWPSQLRAWNPEHVYTLQELCDLLRLTLPDPDTVKLNGSHAPVEVPADYDAYNDANFRWMRTLPKGTPGSIVGERRALGFIPILCPWHGEHKRDPGDGAAYKPGYRSTPAAFRCHHSHGKDAATGEGQYGTDEFLAWCTEQQKLALGGTQGSIEERAAAERAEAKRLGAGIEVHPDSSDPMTLGQMLDRFVYLRATNEVCDLRNPRIAMTFEHFRQYTASSRTEVPDGRSKTKLRHVPVAGAWSVSERRQNLDSRTWLPGGGQYVSDPHGHPGVNIWVPHPDDEPPADWEQRVKLFLEHVEYLVPIRDERAHFLDWFAHIEQRPGDIVHGHYLMVTPQTQGVGRNWLGSLAARLWPGNVALSVSLRSVLDGKFNAELSQKLVAVVDELREGTHGRFWDAAEALKSELTREHRRIKPKYGREHDEYNRLRWLMFSNNLLALPLTEEDRRFWVVENPRVPRDAAYYEQLYGIFRDDAFVPSVRHWLQLRDLSRFNPGARPTASALKLQMIDAIKTDADRALDDLLATWPSDLILQTELQARVFGGALHGMNDGRHHVLRAMLAGIGGQPYPKTVSWGGANVRVAILRNRGRWYNASLHKVRTELLKAQKEPVVPSGGRKF